MEKKVIRMNPTNDSLMVISKEKDVTTILIDDETMKTNPFYGEICRYIQITSANKAPKTNLDNKALATFKRAKRQIEEAQIQSDKERTRIVLGLIRDVADGNYFKFEEAGFPTLANEEEHLSKIITKLISNK